MAQHAIERRLIGGVWQTVDVLEDGGGNGGSQPMLDLGIVNLVDLIDGPVTLYANPDNRLVGPVYLKDITLVDLNGKAIIITREEQLDPEITEGFGPLAGWDSDLVRDGGTWPLQGSAMVGTPLTTGPVGAAIAGDVLQVPTGEPWQANHEYTGNDLIVAAGHAWENEGAGTSGGSAPDFAGNFGGSVVDNDITWDDSGPIDADGSAHVYAFVSDPVTP